ncbi:hypothetical protein H5410_017664 [Solanum commersonii]|uniref:DUF1308 domain-containing protein n=1 Tax=Solanum commersonii TaxID=4109 RepID=A0A9J6A045_SOLCO|nr:hypothetical protein H5410_017664 [Solanum commersonii]
MERDEGAVEEGKRRCKVLKNRIETFTTTQQSSWKTTLFRLINSELSFLNRVSVSNNDSSLKLSSNIGYLEAVVHILQHPLVTAVSRVCKPISISSKLSVYIDVHLLGRFGEIRNCKGLRSKSVELMFAASESSVTVRPSSIILFFSNGLQSCILEKLRGNLELLIWGLGFVILIGEDGETLTDLSGSLGKLHSDDASNDVNLGDSFCALVSALRSWSGLDVEEAELVNFDTTALVAIVSGISNGGIDRILATPETELRSRFKVNYEFMIGQVNSEIKKPIHMELMPSILQKRGIVCESVCSEFQELVSMCGGPNEKSRAEHFLNHLRVVPDCPSERLMNLPTTRKLAFKNKVAFGTGDYWHAPTITANMAFARAVSQTGMSLFTIEHRPRALVGE